ncbi:MAG: ribosome small subunit-dependent GTPase A [Ruminococcaceae bacterium]|nr:ribosome small subunit-dependent GTPase A [Oscillospiraceae bacterium]
MRETDGATDMTQTERHLVCRILASSGGLYTLRAESAEEGSPIKVGDTVQIPARGVFRHKGQTPLVGDLAEIRLELAEDGTVDNERGILMERLLERKNELIRPPMANLDCMLITAAAAKPDPSLLAIDKLTCACVAQNVTPIIIINKCELAPDTASTLKEVYGGAGFPVFTVSAKEKWGEEELRGALLELLPDKIAAFAGASGVGKSSCLNMLFPDLSLTTSAVSHKTGRGRHTTRAVTLIPTALGEGKSCYLADTPGFGLLDFENFHFMEEDQLIWSFPEFEDKLTKCRYTKCTHTKEEGCAILEAVEKGEISRSRHESYIVLREELKKNRYKK